MTGRWGVVAVALLIGVANPARADMPIDQASKFEEVKARLNQMQADLDEIRANLPDLNASAGARADEAVALRSKYPGIAIISTATGTGLYNSLVAYRNNYSHTNRLLLQANLQDVRARACVAVANLRTAYQKMVSGDGYAEMSLADRISFRKQTDDAIADIEKSSGGDPCQPHPTKP